MTNTLKVVSGGQTGADVAGLWIAKLYGIPTGGWAPKGFETLTGPHPEMAATFGIKEHSRSYRGRTIENLKSSNLTIVCSSVNSSGTRLTINQCKEHGIPCVGIWFDPSDLSATLGSPAIDSVIKLIKNMLLIGDVTLNVAGNSTNNSPRAFECTWKVCKKIFDNLGIVPPEPVPSGAWAAYQDRWTK